jgi:hypothetical protein
MNEETQKRIFEALDKMESLGGRIAIEGEGIFWEIVYTGRFLYTSATMIGLVFVLISCWGLYKCFGEPSEYLMEFGERMLSIKPRTLIEIMSFENSCLRVWIDGRILRHPLDIRTG